jgi:hypothetical protein
MVSFQQDFLLIINKHHETYLEKINTIFNNENLIKDLSIDDAEKLIEYIKEYKNLINSICLVIDNINNIKNINNINNKIENELILKMLPIMNLYRILLNEKYNKSSIIQENSTNKSTINDQD